MLSITREQYSEIHRMTALAWVKLPVFKDFGKPGKGSKNTLLLSAQIADFEICLMLGARDAVVRLEHFVILLGGISSGLILNLNFGSTPCDPMT
jgi:hypothetical protein